MMAFADFPGFPMAAALERWFRRERGLGLALGGGGARGLAHIGVLKVLEREGIEVRVVVGASMGGLVAIGWAAGMPAAELEALARRYRVVDVLSRDRTGLGLSSTERVARLVTGVVGNVDLNSLSKRCAVVALDIVKGERVVIDSGPIDRAIQATIAIPGLFSPVRDGSRLLIDGGIIDPVPVEAARTLGAARVIAVDVSPDRQRALMPEPGVGPLPRLLAFSVRFVRFLGLNRKLDLVVKATEIQSAELARLRLEGSRPEVLLRPSLGPARVDQFELVDRMIRSGEQSASEVLPRLRALAMEGRRGR